MALNEFARLVVASQTSGVSTNYTVHFGTPSKMTTEILFQGPTELSGYDRSLTNDKQPSNISNIFLDAMAVRESVFVKEQCVPLMMEADPDDARSCHFVAYDASSKPSKPIGTVRIVPFPHDPHPLPGSSWDIPADADVGPLLVAPAPKFIDDRTTSIHDGKEAYIKLGRWAVVKDYRGRGIAKALVDAALQWAEENPRYFNQDVAGIQHSQSHWNGLVCAHAQKYVANAWEKLGFAIDRKMGEWTEAQIPHVGMWRRLNFDEGKA